jgi:hypothetical protein
MPAGGGKCWMGMGHLYRFGAAWPRPAKGHREVYHGARVCETRWRNRVALASVDQVRIDQRRNNRLQ